MKLLFKKDRDTEEIKDLLGFVDSDINVVNMWADLRTATSELCDIIGVELYNLAQTYYEEDLEEDNIETEFLHLIRYPIALNGYRLNAPSSDLAHTNNGRKMRVDSETKLPFEWMIDRDNASMEKAYFRALDQLLKFLDQQPLVSEIGAKWFGSETFKKTNQFFVSSTVVFDSVFPINSRLLYLKLVPGIEDCELYQIKGRIGEKWATLKGYNPLNIVDAPQQDLDLLRMIRRACVFSAMAWAMPRLSVNIYPEGVLQHYTSDRQTTQGKKPPLKSETEAARQAFKNDADKALREIELLLTPIVQDGDIKIIPEQNFGDTYFST